MRRVGRSVLLLAGCLVALGAVAGCGNGRTRPPDVTRPLLPTGSTPQFLPGAGLAFRTAANWTYSQGRMPLLATTFSGQAVVTIWRYPRGQPLPRTTRQLHSARQALIAASRARDPTFHVQSAQTVRLDHQPAVELVARETVAGQPRTVRSTHVYAFGAEFVIDALAPPPLFDLADRSLFVPLLASLQFSAPPRSPTAPPGAPGTSTAPPSGTSTAPSPGAGGTAGPAAPGVRPTPVPTPGAPVPTGPVPPGALGQPSGKKAHS